jgi:hypothetical protein
MQAAYSSDMTKDRAYRDNRRYWLGLWVGQAGGPKAFAEVVGTVDTYVTAVLKGRRNVGDELAERIERKLGHEPGDMDREPPPGALEDVTELGSALAGEARPLYQVRRIADTVIPQYPTGGSMGRGVLLRDQPGEITSWRVTPEWIQKNVHNVTSPKNLAIVTGFGDSMKPMYNPGDPLLVDTGVKGVEFDGVYFFRIGTEGFIKRLQRVPGEGLVAISENKAYRDWTIKDNMDFEVFARVVKVWRGDDY